MKGHIHPGKPLRSTTAGDAKKDNGGAIEKRQFLTFHGYAPQKKEGGRKKKEEEGRREADGNQKQL